MWKRGRGENYRRERSWQQAIWFGSHSRCPHVHAGIVGESGAPRPMAMSGRIAVRRSGRGSVQLGPLVFLRSNLDQHSTLRLDPMAKSGADESKLDAQKSGELADDAAAEQQHADDEDHALDDEHP